MSAAELVGDLAVLYVELAAVPRPPDFDRCYEFGDRLFRLAVEAGIAVAGAATPPRDALAALADAVQSDKAALLHELLEGFDQGLSTIGRAEGYFYGGKPWDELCWFRSGLGFLAELAGVPLDFEDTDYSLDFSGWEMHEPQEPPPGMPPSHWWWFGASAPA